MTSLDNTYNSVAYSVQEHTVNNGASSLLIDLSEAKSVYIVSDQVLSYRFPVPLFTTTDGVTTLSFQTGGGGEDRALMTTEVSHIQVPTATAAGYIGEGAMPPALQLKNASGNNATAFVVIMWK